eukprot:3604656-Rhodomonas_salina.2
MPYLLSMSGTHVPYLLGMGGGFQQGQQRSALLSAYARATRSPVLTQRMVVVLVLTRRHMPKATRRVKRAVLKQCIVIHSRARWLVLTLRVAMR